MDMDISPTPEVPSQVRQLAAELGKAKPMRRGSLSKRTIKCSKPGCACARDPKARHGPYYSFTHAIEGKTHSRFLTAEQADLVRQQIEAGHEFRGRVDALWEASEQWADRELAHVTGSSEGAKKRGSRPVSKTKSRRKSRAS
jgi:hypothetical protein